MGQASTGDNEVKLMMKHTRVGSNRRSSEQQVYPAHYLWTTVPACTLQEKLHAHKCMYRKSMHKGMISSSFLLVLNCARVLGGTILLLTLLRCGVGGVPPTIKKKHFCCISLVKGGGGGGGAENFL